MKTTKTITVLDHIYPMINNHSDMYVTGFHGDDESIILDVKLISDPKQVYKITIESTNYHYEDVVKELDDD